MTIEENITVVPRLLGWDKKRCHDRARELMCMVTLDPKQYLKRYPRELSGGQQQRIGVIRALAADAPVLLMDEPFGAVDPINRETIQNEFFEMQRALNKTVIMVSHDIDEAIKLGDKRRDLPRAASWCNRSSGHAAGASGGRVRQHLRRPGQHAQAPVAGEGRRRRDNAAGNRARRNAGRRRVGDDGRQRPPLSDHRRRKPQALGYVTRRAARTARACAAIISARVQGHRQRTTSICASCCRRCTSSIRRGCRCWMATAVMSAKSRRIRSRII